jgi:hypothetical protein
MAVLLTQGLMIIFCILILVGAEYVVRIFN